MKTASELGVDPVYQLNSSERRFISRFTASELTELMCQVGAEELSDFFVKLQFH
ncbi:hypothetical protein NB639_01270 [Oxalobacter formigenes]|uniref:hypothetical protein n=1 Tax=Oxalobacter formigenes TaxID=847 RepID=UPI0022AF0EC8|nr:hypothetical protein [Oxalobacter formigenes]WAW06061.1 hypothetical protein NB639_01270 [Oxalobacter formigenes]